MSEPKKEEDNKATNSVRRRSQMYEPKQMAEVQKEKGR